MKTWTKLLLGIGIIVFTSGAASAGVLYSNITSGFPADSGSDTSALNTYFGTTFTTTAGGNLGSIELGVTGTTSPVTLGLYTDSAGEPGTLLESWSAAIPTGSSFPPLTTLTSVYNPLLSASTSYWLVFTQSSAFQVNWYVNDESVAGGYWSGASLTTLSEGYPTGPPGIQLNTIPEPATAMLLGLGFGALLLMKRRG
jgi:hypothetical protein